MTIMVRYNGQGRGKLFPNLCASIVRDMKRLQVPGVAIGVWHKGKEYTAGFGITNIEHPLEVTPDTLFQVGSISKTFTGTMLMQLAEQVWIWMRLSAGI